MKLGKTIRIVFFLLLFPLFLFVSCQIYYFGREAQSQLVIQPDPDISLTAEYFYNNVPIPSTKNIQVFIQTLPWSDMCVDAGGYILYNTYFKGVSWFINNNRIPDTLYDVFEIPTNLGDSSTRDFSTCLLFSVWDTLNAGVHLFEIRLQPHPFDPGRSYQWAIKIEAPTPTPTAP